MNWTHALAYFFAGAFFTNAIPHFFHGVSGRPFQSPFAKPPGKGLSSAPVNVLWGFFNLVIGYLLMSPLGDFNLAAHEDAIATGLGILIMALILARIFGPLHGGNSPGRK